MTWPSYSTHAFMLAFLHKHPFYLIETMACTVSYAAMDLGISISSFHQFFLQRCNAFSFVTLAYLNC